MKQVQCVIICGLILLFLSSCTGILQVDKTKLVQKQNPVRSMISIDPNFEFIKVEKSRTKKLYAEAAQMEEDFNSILIKNAKKNKVNLTVVDIDNYNTVDANYFNYLAPLKREILQVNYLQDFEKEKNSPFSTTNINKHDEGPRISSRFSNLATIYDTRYFAVHGVTLRHKGKKGNALMLFTLPPVGLASFFTPESEMVYYVIVVDVINAQIVYREYRKLDLNSNKTNLNTIIFDSFKLITN